MKLLTALFYMTLLSSMSGNSRITDAPPLLALHLAQYTQTSDTTLPVWPKNHVFNHSASFQSSMITTAALTSSKRPLKAILGFTQKNRPVEVYYFPGSSNEKALVLGGVHGSELSAMEVVKQLVEDLSAGTPIYYSVIVIPCLFPDNAAAAAQYSHEINSTKNIGRYTQAGLPDPNRQMPPLGKAFNPDSPLDFAQRTIERENQLLLQLIQEFKPDRIVNVHAIRNIAKAGIFADPRTDCEGLALGYETDSLLAINMATYIHQKGGNVSGNGLAANTPNTLYSSDPPIAPKGALQKRNLYGSQLPNNLGMGVSLGSWAATAVCDANRQYQRPAMRVITVEFPGNKRPADYTAAERKEHEKQLSLYAGAISQVFLTQTFTQPDYN